VDGPCWNGNTSAEDEELAKDTSARSRSASPRGLAVARAIGRQMSIAWDAKP
jgi:hypothetical protein